MTGSYRRLSKTFHGSARQADEALRNMIDELAPNREAVGGLRSGGAPILLLATGVYLGEGFDLPILDTLFLAFPISGRSRVVQYVGRVTRALPDKTSVEVHDSPRHPLHPLLRRMHQRRLAALKSIGFVPTAPA